MVGASGGVLVPNSKGGLTNDSWLQSMKDFGFVNLANLAMMNG